MTKADRRELVVIRSENANEFKKGVIAGLIAAAVMFFFIEAFSWLDIIKFGQSYLGGETVFNYENTFPVKIISFFMSVSIGMFWGVILAFLFTKTFTDELYIMKGMGFSFVIFIFHLGILDESFHYKRELHEETLNLLIILMGYLIYGATASIILKKLGIFKS